MNQPQGLSRAQEYQPRQEAIRRWGSGSPSTGEQWGSKAEVGPLPPFTGKETEAINSTPFIKFWCQIP